MNLQSLFLLQATQAPAKTGSPWISIGMMVLLVLVFWLFFIRPQSKKQKEVQKQRDALAVGDNVLTAGGIRGTIREVSDSYFLIEIDKNVHIRIEKTSVYPANY
ncbi:preprotein translocase, YajC subunit [Bacteroidales bacterium KA00251]|nr:preprotein translocase, YajC subunit [Bacteroidales bacterium KA00251]